MKKVILAGILGLSLLLPTFLPTTEAFAATWVNGYTKSNGTYVQGHYRSNADGNPYNNWSFPGNTNPYTGVTAGGSVDAYLRNYSNSSYTPSYYPSSYYSSLGSSYSSTYESLSNGHKSYGIVFSDYGYYEKNGTCVKEPTNGYAIGSSVFCDYGYVLSGDQCTKYEPLSYRSSYPSKSYKQSTSDSCPAHSSKSQSGSTKCTCDIGYQVNDDGTKCVKIPATDNNEICRESFGSSSIWSKEYADDRTPLCACKTKYQWDESGKECVRKKIN